MYENGKQMNRYANKMIHKRKQKKKYTRSYFRGYRGASWEDYCAHAEEWDDLEYWKEWYLSGSRKFASECTNSKLRSCLKNDLSHMDYEEMYAPQHGEYKKFFDYAWTVW